MDRVVARTYADRALRDAVDLNRRGAVGRRPARRCARSPGGSAPTPGRDEVLRGIVAELEREAEAWAVQRMEFDRKVAVLAVGLRAQVAGHLRRRDAPARHGPGHDPRRVTHS